MAELRRTSWLILALLAGCGSCRQPEPPRVRVWIAGDVHLGAPRNNPLQAVAERMRPALGIVNLEGPIGDGAEESNEARLVNAPSVARLLSGANVAVAGIANNHAQDLGEAGLTATAKALEEAGVQVAFGARYATISSGGLNIAVTAHDLSEGAPASLREELTLAKASADLLIATFHVTGPRSLLPSPELQAAVDVALGAGAVIVAAHGTHALARVERRGATVIAWGLGNLAFNCACSRAEDGLVLRATLTRAGVEAVDVFPMDAGIDGAPATFAKEPEVTYALLEALRSSPLLREGDHVSLR